MDQNLINQFFSSLMQPQNIIAQGIALKAICLRHYALHERENDLDQLTEDEESELSYLTEILTYAHMDYWIDADNQITLFDT